ncbi:MAG: hypothetical protein HFI93_11585 [Lachnospiraceae bacterium]|nr:hypothetical protein [Lachnospiraceae bacterium]
MKKRIAAVLACFVMALLFIFVRRYEHPLPFDANRMFVEPIEAVRGIDAEGNGFLSSLDELNFEESRAVLAGKYDVIDLVWLTCRGINAVASVSHGRTIRRDGEEIRVVYFCYYKTLWESLFEGDFAYGSESVFWFGDIYGGDPYGSAYEARKREVYYLPARELLDYEKMTGLSDEAFDALRKKGELIWSGVV